MKNIPTGTVTFLFTDIEGSTRLAQEFPGTLPAALEKHHSILTKATESNNGFVYEIVGDAFCCAFEKAEDAVKAAVEAQINLANEKWDDAEIKIRIGIHTGNVEWNGKRYMGYITLARTARVMSAAYGEQIIISNDAYELSKEKIPDKISFRDLGERRLKDLKQPVRLFQILSEGLREDFPPIKTLDARPNNLPVQLTSFIGREAEMKTVKDLLKQTHLLTLTGSGGAGKTRFALQVGADVIDDFANGVWFVELASLSEPAFLPQAIMKVFELKEEPKRSLEETLCDYLRDKEMLIILDNCEHLVEACSKLAEKLLSISPKLKIIATSREALRCEGEQTHRTLSLEVPDPKDENSPEKLSQFEAVRLFIERALAVDETFRVNNDNAPALAEICFQLDGIPLAIELAAARTKVLSVQKIYERLNDRFNLLTGGKRTALPRQQTLRALIDWSYDLLTEKEKILWRRVSVFSGGWTLEAAEEVCSNEEIRKEEVLELLNQLTEKSLIVFEKEIDRYFILESLKQYGKEKLRGTSEAEDILRRHLHCYMKLSKIAEPKLIGSDMQIWLEILDADHDNLQAAIKWSIGDGEIEEGAQLTVALMNFWDVRGYYSTGRQLFERILENTQSISKSSLGKILNYISVFTLIQCEYDRAQEYSNRSLTLFREIEDKPGIARSLSSLGDTASQQGDHERAQKFYEETLAVFQEIGDKRGIANTLSCMGDSATQQGNYEDAQRYSEESLALHREIGDKRRIAISLTCLGNVSYVLGNYEQSQKFYEEGLRLRRETGDKRRIAESLINMGNVAYDRGNYDQARIFYEESITLFREIGIRRGIAFSLYNLGNVAYDQGNFDQGQKFHEESLRLRREIRDIHGIATSLNSLGNAATEKGNYEDAKKFHEESLRLRREIKDIRGIAYSLNDFGYLEYDQGNFELAQKFYNESLFLQQEIGDKLGTAYSLNNLGNVECEKGNYEQAHKYLKDSLALTREIGDKRGIAFSLTGFACIFSAGNNLSRAVLLLAVVEEALKSMGIIFDRIDQKLKDKIILELREKLTNYEFSKYFEEGKKLSLEEAADLALSSIE